MLTNYSPVTTALQNPVRTPGDRVVLKIGTSSLVSGGLLDEAKLERLCDAVYRGMVAGLRPVLVASGAIAIGSTRHPALAGREAVAQQVAAALGQSRLYTAVEAAFADRGVQTGQLLLTPPDLVEPDRDCRVRQTLDTMLALDMVPVVNENDALGVRNNDVLAGLLGGYLGAELLLLLTNVPGLYDSNPLLADGARHIGDIAALTPELEELAGGSIGDGGTGGMRTKLGACWIATFSGVRTVIADAADPDVLVAAHRGRPVGTAVHPRAGAPAGLRSLWYAFRTPPRAALHCTPAGEAALRRGATLRHRHIEHVEHLGRAAAAPGGYLPGDVVDLRTAAGRPLARGTASGLTEPGCAPDCPIVAAGDYVRIVEDPQ